MPYATKKLASCNRERRGQTDRYERGDRSHERHPPNRADPSARRDAHPYRPPRPRHFPRIARCWP